MPFSTGSGTGTGIFLTRSQGRVADIRGVRSPLWCCKGGCAPPALRGGWCASLGGAPVFLPFVGPLFCLGWLCGAVLVRFLCLSGRGFFGLGVVGWGLVFFCLFGFFLGLFGLWSVGFCFLWPWLFGLVLALCVRVCCAFPGRPCFTMVGAFCFVVFWMVRPLI